jgi:hypothetical protein
MKNNLRNVLTGVIVIISLLGPILAQGQVIEPGKEIEYRELAFYPKRWEQAKISTKLVPWEGKNIVFLTTERNLSKEAMTSFVQRLDAGWQLYADLIGRTPRVFRQWNGRPTIAAVPKGSLTCGYGCGYIGATGIEVSGFYQTDYPLAVADPNAFSHYYFYEMGRNFYTLGDRHSLFITGYAVFMRYVCMDALHCKDPDTPTRATIERCEAIYAASDIPFLAAFTNLSEGEKRHRLKNKKGKPIIPSDQPVIYATAMLKLREDHGGDAWVKRFFRYLSQCPKVKPKNESDAISQSLNWLVAASAAARKDLTCVFVDRWRMPLDKSTRESLGKVDWKDAKLDVASIIGTLQHKSTDQ